MASPSKRQLVATMLQETITLTPVRKKRLRPSLSPAKSTPMVEASSHRPARTSDSFQEMNILQPDPSYDIPTAALNFKEFSFLDDNGKIDEHGLESEEQDALLSYLSTVYTVVSMHMMPPFLYLECYQLPPEEKRPFTIAGLVAVWSPIEDEDPINFYLGQDGEGDEIEIPENIAHDIREQHIPSDDTIIWLATHVFKDAVAISLIWNVLVVSLPETSDDNFAARLKDLPESISNSTIAFLLYHNGHRLQSEYGRERVITPDPSVFGGKEDDTDYVETDKKFYPGTMIKCYSSTKSFAVTASILVSKGDEKRLIVSHHCCQDAIEEDPRVVVKGIPLYQGKSVKERGTHVADLVGRIGETDLGLAKLCRPFENAFMELACAPKRLLKTKEINIGDQFLIDSCFTGRQRLMCVGTSKTITRSRQKDHPNLQGDPAMLPDSSLPYVELDQRQYASNTRYIPSSPRIRAGVCGAILVRCKIAKRNLDSDQVLALGEVGGIMHFVDLRPKYSIKNNLLCFADSFDQMIAEGWEVASES